MGIVISYAEKKGINAHYEEKDMISEIDLLRDDIPRLEKTFGAGNPFVEVLKAHLDTLQHKKVQLTLRELSHRKFVNFKRLQIQKRNESSNSRQ